MYHFRTKRQLFKQGQRAENSKRWEETSSGCTGDLPRNHSSSFSRVWEKENFFLQVPWLRQNLRQVLASQGAHENLYWGKALLVSLEQLQLEVKAFYEEHHLMNHQLQPTFYYHQILKSIYPLFNIERKIGPKAWQIYITSWNCGFGWQKVVFFFGTEIEEGLLKNIL